MIQSPTIDPEWAWTPDVVLFIAAAVLSVGVTLFSLWLFRRAAREERAKVEKSSRPNSGSDA